jgi:hypothetical protein
VKNKKQKTHERLIKEETGNAAISRFMGPEGPRTTIY